MDRIPTHSAFALATVLAIVGTLAVGPTPRAPASPVAMGIFGSGRYWRPIALPGVPRPGQPHGRPRSRAPTPRRRLEPGRSAAGRWRGHGPSRGRRLHPRLRLRPPGDNGEVNPDVDRWSFSEPQRPGSPAAHGAGDGGRPARAARGRGCPWPLRPGRPLLWRHDLRLYASTYPDEVVGHGAPRHHARGVGSAPPSPRPGARTQRGVPPRRQRLPALRARQPARAQLMFNNNGIGTYTEQRRLRACLGGPSRQHLSKHAGRVADFQDHPNRKPAVLTVTQPLTPRPPDTRHAGPSSAHATQHNPIVLTRRVAQYGVRP